MTASDILYKEATNRDIPALARIRATNRETKLYWNNRIEGYLNGSINPQKALAPRIIYIASENDEIIGFIAGHLTHRFECDGELEWINVIKNYRRNGIASKLIKILAGWFVEQNAYKICVDPGNREARIFYKKNKAQTLNQHWMVWDDIRIIL